MPYKGILGIDACKIEVVRTGVVIGQGTLVAVGRVDIKRAGLQRLHQGPSPERGVPLEHQTTVQAEGRHHAVCGVAPVGQHRVKLVGRRMQLELRGDEACGCQPGAADLQLGVGALGIGLQGFKPVGLELGEVTVHREIQALQIGLGIPRRQLWHTVVRRHDGRRGVLQGLPLQHPGTDADKATPPGGIHIVGQQPLCQGGTAAGEILPVVVVTDAVQVDRQPHLTNVLQAGVNTAGVQIAHAPAVRTAQLVRRHVIGPHRAAVGRLQVAELSAQVHATQGHQGGGDGGIPVGCNVPVVGNDHFGAIDVVHPDGRRQHTGLALVAQRKTDCRHRQNGHPLEAQHRARGNPDILIVVQRDGGGAQYPVGQPARSRQAAAGGVGRVVDDGMAFIQKVDTVRLAMGIVLQKLVARLVEKTFKPLHL